MHLAHLNIGSNYGDRRACIARAVALLRERFDIAGISDYVESEPWGFESEHPFLNVGVSIHTGLDPLALLDAVQEIERAVSPMPHRNADGSYRDRAIDIDIIFIDNLCLSTPRLVVPHPRAHLRDFVLGPLRQLHPDHPLVRGA